MLIPDGERPSDQSDRPRLSLIDMCLQTSPLLLRLGAEPARAPGNPRQKVQAQHPLERPTQRPAAIEAVEQSTPEKIADGTAARRACLRFAYFIGTARQWHLGAPVIECRVTQAAAQSIAVCRLNRGEPSGDAASHRAEQSESESRRRSCARR